MPCLPSSYRGFQLELLLSDKEIEEACIGSFLVLEKSLPATLKEIPLLPNHFYKSDTRTIYKQILDLYEEGSGYSVDLVASYMQDKDLKNYVYVLAGRVDAPGNAVHYAKRVYSLFRWRERRRIAQEMITACEKQSIDTFTKAESRLRGEDFFGDGFESGKDLTDAFAEFLEKEETDLFVLPFSEGFNDALGGGLRRGQNTALGGWTSHGKSVLVDQISEYLTAQGHKVHIYLNEMTTFERTARYVARNSRLPLTKLLKKDLSKKDLADVRKLLVTKPVPYSMSNCAGWTIEELCFDIKGRDLDFVVIDILHQFDHDSEGEIARMSRMLNRVSKQANCHILYTVHLNEFRATDITRPRPVNRDIRGSGMIKNDADNVMFVYREQDPYSGNPSKAASVYMTKNRNGPNVFEGLTFNEQDVEFNCRKSSEVKRSMQLVS